MWDPGRDPGSRGSQRGSYYNTKKKVPKKSTFRHVRARARIPWDRPCHHHPSRALRPNKTKTRPTNKTRQKTYTIVMQINQQKLLHYTERKRQLLYKIGAIHMISLIIIIYKLFSNYILLNINIIIISLQ